MALSAGQFVVAGSVLQTTFVGSERGESVAPSAQWLSMSNMRMVTPLQHCFSFPHVVAPVARRQQLHAVATNSRVLELEEEFEVLELEKEEEEEEEEKEEENSPLTPNPFEIQNLIMQICDETSNVAEVQLKVGTFSLRVRRDIGKAAAPAPPSPPKPVAAGPPVLGKAVPSAPKSTKLAKTTLSAADVKPVSNFGLIEAAADEGLLFIASPKVGLFRKRRTLKGKSGPPLCEEGQVVKKGQVVCYLEQLGTQQPVEADITGEVEKVLWKDGEPVGYGDPLIAIRPSFPGIKV